MKLILRILPFLVDKMERELFTKLFLRIPALFVDQTHRKPVFQTIREQCRSDASCYEINSLALMARTMQEQAQALEDALEVD